MARRLDPLAPRLTAPVVPNDLEPGEALHARNELFRLRFPGLSGQVDAAHSTIQECTFDGARLDSWELTGASVIDVEISDLRAVTLMAREGRWRNVRVERGRIATVDLSGATLDSVELRGLRIDYLNLRGASVSDVLIADCRIDTLDCPQATFSRVRFEESTADEIDNRGIQVKSVDLRGLDVGHVTDPSALRGVTMAEHQVVGLARDFATAAGIDLRM